jgi:hypothetical protein
MSKRREIVVLYQREIQNRTDQIRSAVGENNSRVGSGGVLDT